MEDPIQSALEEEAGAPFATEESKEENRVEYFCGIGKCRPKFLQRLRNTKFFTFLLCCDCLLEGALVSGFVPVVLSSLELRYQLSSLEVGLIPSVYDMAVLLSVIFISYFAGKGNKPRWLGISLLIQGTGALVFALPEFVFGEYVVGARTERLESCIDEITHNQTCESGENRYALVFFYTGHIMVGFGAAALFTVGPSYIDDIVRPKFVSIHLGFIFMCVILGAALGFGLGGAFLSVYVDFWRETNKNPDLNPSDPDWVGAWWLCFLFAAVVSWLLAIPFLMFPKLLPNSHLVKAEREKEMAQKYGRDVSLENSSYLTKMKSFPHHLQQVVTTPSWIFITIATCFSAFVINGVVAFIPKFFETQFSLSSSVASVSAGGVSIPTAAAGVLAGALIIYFTKSKGRTVALFNWIVILVALPFLSVFLAYCPSTQLVGVNVPFADGDNLHENTGPPFAACNRPCNCTSSIYEPVCGADGFTHYSPCYAGCEKGFIDNDTSRPFFENCTCILENLALGANMSMDMLATMSTATEGTCDNGCVSFGIFMGLSVIGLFLIFIIEVPNIFITIRCVSDEQRALALGVQSFFFRLLGNVPGPVVVGAIFDSACLNFRYDFLCTDPSRGNCWVYDNFQLSWSVIVLVLSGISATLVFSFLTWFAYPKQNVSDRSPLTNELSEFDAPQDIDTGKTSNHEDKQLKKRSSQRVLLESVTE